MDAEDSEQQLNDDSARMEEQQISVVESNSNMNALQQHNANFAKIEPKIRNVSRLMEEELNLIERKELELDERFKSQLDQCNEAKEQRQYLKEEHKVLTENTTHLAWELDVISDELDEMKKKTEEKASSVTDAKPLVEIRKAIQRLRKENRDMDIQIGVLEWELTKARKIEAEISAQEHTNDGLDDDESDDDEDYDES